MSARLSTVFPRACSGAMYAAVPRIIPACVIAGDVTVGEFMRLGARRSGGVERLRKTEVEHLHRAVRAHLDVGGLQITMNDALLVRGFQRLRDLLRDGQRFIERHSGLPRRSARGAEARDAL